MLHAAVSNGHDTIVAILLASSVDKDAQDNDGWTALHLAACGGHDNIAAMLLFVGANVDTANAVSVVSCTSMGIHSH